MEETYMMPKTWRAKDLNIRVSV